MLTIMVLISGPSFSIAQSEHQEGVNLDLLEQLLIRDINAFRRKNGLDVLQESDTLRNIAEMECRHLCENGMVKNPNTLKYFEYFYGDQVYSSYNSSISTRWMTSTFTDWSNIESRMAEGYILQYSLDKREQAILVSKKQPGRTYRGFIGLSCEAQGKIIYVSQVIFIQQ